MNVAINARFLLKDKMEGIGHYTWEIIRRIIILHPEHRYFFIFDRAFDQAFIFHPSIHPIIIGPQARHPILWYWWFEKSIPKVLKDCRADVFLSMDGYCSLTTERQQVMVIHDLAYRHFPEQVPLWVRLFYKYYVPRYVQKADHLVTVSEASRRDVSDMSGIDTGLISVAYNGCRTEFRPLNGASIQKVKERLSAGEPYFIFVGAIHPRKNVLHLLQAFERFKWSSGSCHKLILVGRKAWMTEDLDRYLASMSHRSSVIWMPYLAANDLADAVAAASALICPSYLEGFGVPVLEALMCDVPVIISNRFSLPEVGGPGAYLVDPDSPEQISYAMETVLKDPDLPHRIELGRSHRTKFDWDKSAEVIAKIIFQKDEN